MVPIKGGAGLAACGKSLLDPLVERQKPVQQLAVLRYLSRKQLLLFIVWQAPIKEGLPFLLYIVG